MGQIIEVEHIVLTLARGRGLNDKQFNIIISVGLSRWLCDLFDWDCQPQSRLDFFFWQQPLRISYDCCDTSVRHEY